MDDRSLSLSTVAQRAFDSRGRHSKDMIERENVEKYRRFGMYVWEWENPATRWKYQAVKAQGSNKVALWHLEPTASVWQQAYERDIAPGRTAEQVVDELHERTMGKKP